MSQYSKKKHLSDVSSTDKHHSSDTKQTLYSYKAGPDPSKTHSAVYRDSCFDPFGMNPGYLSPDFIPFPYPGSLIGLFPSPNPGPCPTCPGPCPTCASPCPNPCQTCPACPDCNCSNACPTCPACPDCDCPNPCPTCPDCNCPSPCPNPCPTCPACPDCNCPSPCPTCPACPDCDCPAIPEQQNLTLLNPNSQAGSTTGVNLNLGTQVYSTGTDITFTAPNTINFTSPGLYQVYYAGDFLPFSPGDALYVIPVNVDGTVYPGSGITIVPNSTLIDEAFNNTFYVTATAIDLPSINFTALTTSTGDTVSDFTVTVMKVVV